MIPHHCHHLISQVITVDRYFLNVIVHLRIIVHDVMEVIFLQQFVPTQLSRFIDFHFPIRWLTIVHNFIPIMRLVALYLLSWLLNGSIHWRFRSRH